MCEEDRRPALGVPLGNEAVIRQYVFGFREQTADDFICSGFLRVVWGE